MPARHKSLQTICFSKQILDRWLWSTKEGVGETSGQTAGSTFRRAQALDRKPVRQKKLVFFVRCGSLELRNFTGPQSPK